MSGTFTSLWVYVLATIGGGIAAALLHKYVVATAVAPHRRTRRPAGRRQRRGPQPGHRPGHPG